MGYLTPETLPADTICRVLFIPNNEEFLANVTGALQLLTFASSWVKQGALTPEQAAAALVPMFDSFCFNEGACRVIGEIICFAGDTSPDPTRWLACDGTSLLRADYPDLFVVIGTAYGAADSTHFSLPDLRGRVSMGIGTGPGLSARALGDSIGEETHQLVAGEMPSHTHGIGGVLLTSTVVPPPLDGLSPGLPTSTGSAGGDGAHNNIQPSLAINYFIVALQ